MKSDINQVVIQDQASLITQYYKFQSTIYDRTRWSFLFGRKNIIKLLPFQEKDRFSVVELGCGTGANIKYLAKAFPFAQIIGCDVSLAMLDIAKEKCKNLPQVQWEQRLFIPGEKNFKTPPQVVLLSYVLTMLNPMAEQVIQQVWEELPEGGYIAVVDFHGSPSTVFKTHMSKHHVKMEQHLLPILMSQFTPVHSDLSLAYGGIWSYFTFIGKKRADHFHIQHW